ncbi:MAG: hypothetical protein KDB63_04115 [Nocardioidaceae bacterium]|nr:hypothetical protein [Nocardioidaceae bacterium]
MAQKVRPGSTRVQVEELRLRIAELETELQEARRLNVRVAELLDIVEELLVPLAQRDEAKVKAYLDSHASAL